jgi:hypothetical protein
MTGFGNYSHAYDTRLHQQPWYRKGAAGPDPLALFTQKTNLEYRKQAENIRDMRFARSNELDIDTAVRRLREKQISADVYSNPATAQGIYSRKKMRLSRSGGPLAGKPGVYEAKAETREEKREQRRGQQREEEEEKQDEQQSAVSPKFPTTPARNAAREKKRRALEERRRALEERRRAQEEKNRQSGGAPGPRARRLGSITRDAGKTFTSPAQKMPSSGVTAHSSPALGRLGEVHTSNIVGTPDRPVQTRRRRTTTRTNVPTLPEAVTPNKMAR